MQTTIGRLIGGGMSIVFLLFITLVATTTVAVNNYREQVLVLSSEALPQNRLIGEVRANTQRAMYETVNYLVTNNATHLEEQQQAIAEFREAAAALIAVHQEDVSGQQEESQLITDMLSKADEVMVIADNTVALKQQGQNSDLTIVTRDLDAVSEAFEQSVVALNEVMDEEAEEATEAINWNPLVVTRAISVGVLIVLVWLFFALRGKLVRPLRSLRDATLGVAAGNYERQVTASSTDEIGDLGRAFNTMVGRVGEQQRALQDQIDVATTAALEAQQARAELEMQIDTIEQQRLVIREMSVPILPLNSRAMVMPLVGELDTERLRAVQEQALQAIERTRTDYLILDITGVPMIDTQVAHGLLQVVRAGRLLGAEVLMVGIRPEVAQAIVGLGLQLDQVRTHSSLQSGISYVMGRDHRAMAMA